jgi:cation diffusion facilitator family transporter
MTGSDLSLKPQAAHEAARAKERVALGSIAASALITLAKGTAGLATGSLALISDAAHSLLDVAATTMTWFAVRAANKPADEEHHYGHGKFESLAALIETAFLFLLSGAVALEGVQRLLTGESTVQASWAAAGVLVGAIVVDAWRWRQLKRVAAETGSEALEADALHFSSDLVNSVLVLAALGATALGYPQADALVAVLVALFIAVAGFRLAQRTLGTLLDAAPKGLAERVKAEAQQVPGVVLVERVRVRPAGGQVFGELLVRVSRTLPLENVAAIKRKVSQALDQELSGSEITVTAEPIALNDETILERVIVQDIGGRFGISLDVEVDGRMSLGAAHQKADSLEVAIQEELGPDVEVDTHIEPLRLHHLEGADERAEIVARIARDLAQTAEQVGQINDIHSVRVRRTEDGLVVNYHCRVDPALTVFSVHDHVDELERRVRIEHPDILRVIGHAEPMRA